MARAFARDAMASWIAQGGDEREIAVAMLLQGYGAHLILRGQADIIAMYERAAAAVDLAGNAKGSS